jgi:hypothetical protein
MLLWQLLAIIALAFLLHGQTLRNGYLTDDRIIISENVLATKK